MGFFSNLFGGGKKSGTSAEQALLDDEKRIADEERAKADALKLKQEEERLALKRRGTSMQGGGRTGLMFGANESGVA